MVHVHLAHAAARTDAAIMSDLSMYKMMPKQHLFVELHKNSKS